MLTGVSVDRVAYSNGVFSVEASGTEVRATNLLIATGRRASPAAVGAETIGVPADARRCRWTGNSGLPGSTGSGPSATSPARGLHPRRRVPGSDRGTGHPWGSWSVGRLRGTVAGDLHRSGSGIGRAQ